MSGNKAICEIYIDLIDAEKNSAVLNALLEHRAEVENIVGEELHWDDIQLKRACRVRAITVGDVAKEGEHESLIDWMIDHQLKMKSVFKPLVENLPDDLWG